MEGEGFESKRGEGKGGAGGAWIEMEFDEGFVFGKNPVF